MGTNVIFPKEFMHDYRTCAPALPEEGKVVNETCFIEQENYYRTQQEEEKVYNGWKLLFLILLNLAVLLITLFATRFDQSLVLGLFLGAVLTTFIAVIMYFESRSVWSFLSLAVLFILVIYFMHLRRDKLFVMKR